MPLNDITFETSEPVFFFFFFFFSNFMRILLLKGDLKICSNGHGPLIKMTAMSIYGKTLKDLLQNHECFEAESWNIPFGTQGLPSLFK